MKTEIEIDYFIRMGDHQYKLIYERLSDNLIFGGDDR